MAIIQIETAFNIDLEFEIAPFHKRLFAYIIDFTILIIFLFSMKFVLYSAFSTGLQDSIGIDILVISLPMLLYSLLTELWMNGQTVGKKLMAIRVISLDGKETSFGQYVLRWITKFFEWPFLFGYIAAGALSAYIFITGFFGIAVMITIMVTKKHQRLGDIAAGTVVVATKSDMSVSDTVFMDVRADNYKVLFPQVMRLTDTDINTIKSVITQARKRGNNDIVLRVQNKVKEVLQIQSSLDSLDFLEKLMEDYNYMATKE